MGTSDDLGNDEFLDETQTVNGVVTGLRVHAKYHVRFTNKRTDAFQ